MATVASEPKPVETPYTGSSEETSLATTSALCSIAARASGVNVARVPPLATETTSGRERSGILAIAPILTHTPIGIRAGF
jgi:hypothetical protein